MIHSGKERRQVRQKVYLSLVIFLIASLMIPWSARAQDNPPQAPMESPAATFKAGEILVKPLAGASANARQAAIQAVQATYISTLYDSSIEIWAVEAGQELEAIEQLQADPNIEFAEPNYIMKAFDVSLTPNDPYYGSQWAHPKIRSPQAWDISTGSNSVIIAIVDSGVDLGHPDLSSKLVAGYDFVGFDSTPADENGHGTHVSGIAGALGNNGLGVAGLDWQARLMPVRVLDYEGSGYLDAVASGITWAYQHGAKVINMSLGGSTSFCPSTMQQAIDNAYAAGALVVAAMGNNGNATVHYPAACNNVMAVASTTSSDTRSYFSNYGPHCDIAAPGSNIYSTMPTYDVYLNYYEHYSKNYDYLDGTSMATPYVSGLAALLWSVSPSLTPDQVQSTIQQNAVDLGTIGKDIYYGYGRIDAYNTVAAYGRPAAPNLLPINNADQDGNYLVDWDPVSNATSYTLQEDDNSSFTSPAVHNTGSSTQFQVNGQQSGTWYYRVRGANAYGDGAWSNVQTAVVLGVPQLNAISNSTQSDHYKVSWSTVTSATSYTLEEDDNTNFTSPAVRYEGLAVEYNVTGQQGGTWYYRVRASNSVGYGAWSNKQSTIVAAAALTAPSLAVIDNPDNDGNYLVDWSDVGGATGYILEQSRTPYFDTPAQVYQGPASQFSVTNHPGGTWYYRVRASGSSGMSPWSSTRSVSVKVYIFMPTIYRDASQQLW